MTSAEKEEKRAEDERILSGILKELSEPRDKETCFCSYAVFRAVYDAAKQSGRPGYLVLCSLVNKGDWQIQERRDAMAKASDCLADAIEADIPAWGVACRYDRDQYLLLFTDTKKEECEEVGRRIEAGFRKACPEAYIRWKMNRVDPVTYAGQERRRS